MNIDWGQIILTALPVLFGIGFVWIKVTKILAALVELADVISVINSSLQDKNLTKEEITQIKKEINEAIEKFKEIFKK